MNRKTMDFNRSLKDIALSIRRRTIETSSANIPHLGSCLSAVELLTVLYWKEMNIDPQAPEALNRDRFILSKGHGAPVLFQVLAERGFSQLRDFQNSASVEVCFMSIHQNLDS